MIQFNDFFFKLHFQTVISKEPLEHTNTPKQFSFQNRDLHIHFKNMDKDSLGSSLE